MSDLGATAGRQPDLTAAEYVVGLLDSDGRQAAQARLTVDPAFGREVAWWEARLTPLADTIPPTPPSPALWDRIAALIEPRDADGLWRNLGFWRAISAASIAAALGFGVVVAALLARAPVAPPAPITPPGAPAAPTLVATINAPVTDKPVLVATLDRATRRLILTPVGLKVGAGRSAELWVIPEGGKARSLGVIDARGAASVPMPADLDQPAPTAKLAVTDEPPGGSPTGVATGPIVAVGGFAALP